MESPPEADRILLRERRAKDAAASRSQQPPIGTGAGGSAPRRHATGRMRGSCSCSSRICRRGALAVSAGECVVSVAGARSRRCGAQQQTAPTLARAPSSASLRLGKMTRPACVAVVVVVSLAAASLRLPRLLAGGGGERRLSRGRPTHPLLRGTHPSHTGGGRIGHPNRTGGVGPRRSRPRRCCRGPAKRRPLLRTIYPSVARGGWVHRRPLSE